MNKLKNILLLLLVCMICACGSASAQSIQIKSVAQSEKRAAFVLVNKTNSPMSVFYEAEIFRDGKWRPWPYGVVTGRLNEISEPFTLKSDEERTIIFSIEGVPVGPIPDGSATARGRALAFRLKVTVEHGLENIYSEPFHFQSH